MDLPTILPVNADDAAIYQIGSDRYPYTVIARSKSGHCLTLRSDTYRRTDKNGQSEAQSYVYQANPKGREIKAYKRKDGHYHHRSAVIFLGSRDAYSDPSF